MRERRGDDRANEKAAVESAPAPTAAVASGADFDDFVASGRFAPSPGPSGHSSALRAADWHERFHWRAARVLTYPGRMGEGPDDANPEVERILDEMLDDLAEFFDDDFRDDVRDFMLDAAAAHPVGRVLAERLKERQAPERSGEHVDGEPALASETIGKAGGDR